MANSVDGEMERTGRKGAAGAGKESTLPQDLLASLVVFLVALPLCMGIAIASGAPPAAGLITGIVGGLVTGFLAGCPLQVSGPAAGLAVIVLELINKYGFVALGPIVILAGIIQFGAGMLRLGQVFRAIGPAVIYGMLAGIGILILAAQFHVMVDDKPRENGWRNLVAIPEAVYKGVFPVDGSSHHMAALLGLMTIVVLLIWSKVAPARVKWIPGALLGVVAATATAKLAGLPVRYVELPNSLLDAVSLTGASSLFASAMQPPILLAALTIAFVASAETLLSAAAVDQMHDGPRTNYDKELWAQGVGNALSGLLGGLPMTGVIVRSATNVNAGAKTRRSAILHGLWLLIMVAALPTVLRMVPTASLAAILVYTGYKLISPENIRKLLNFGRAPVAIYAATVVMIVATDLLTGIVTGLVLSVAKLVWAQSRVHIDVQQDPERRRIDVRISGSATFLRLPTIVDTLTALPEGPEIHIHFHDLAYIDHAAIDALSTWRSQRLRKNGTVVIEWDELMEKYRDRNQFLTSTPKPEPAASHAKASRGL